MGANLPPALPPLPPLVKKLDKNKWKTTQKILTIYPSGALLKDNFVFLDILFASSADCYHLFTGMDN